jgi:phosphoribosylformimino-5-aminoimidazole carboxamide ribotide isomerase
MLIPSIDLMGGKIVQLVQGERMALEFENFDSWIDRFSSYPLVQLIDLDAALGTGSNRWLVERFTTRLPCQLGGGIRTIEDAKTALQSGAQRVIVGSSLVHAGQPNAFFAAEMCAAVGRERLVFALDSKEGRVAVRGWRELTNITADSMMLALEPWCSAFLYTHVDTEGLMRGLPLDAVRPLRLLTRNQLIVAGGIASAEEVEQLDALSIDAVVGMAIYSGRLRV